MPKNKRKVYRRAINKFIKQEHAKGEIGITESDFLSKKKLFSSIIISHPEKFQDIVEFIKNLPRKESDGDDMG